MNRDVDADTYVEKADAVYINKTESRPTLPSNIPAAKGFIGREDDLSTLRKEKQNGRTSFVLHGTGGVGKTELALKFIEEIKGEFQTHIRVDMQGLANALSPDDAMLEVIRAFRPDVPSLPPEQIESLYISLLNQHKTLLFFDNAKDRDQVEPLNQKTAFVIITSRANFKATDSFSKKIEQMSLQDARDLLYFIAGEERFDGKAAELARLAGYLPMALSPLASILAEDVTENVTDLIKKYSDRKERLRLADPNRENLSVEASFDLSYERLSDDLKERWRKLAVFPADFDLEALKAIWRAENAKESLSALVKSNLVIFDEKSRRSRLHDLARDYTREKISDEEFFLAELFHAIYYGKLLASLSKVTLGDLALFDLERINIEVGFAWLKDKVQISNEVADICLYYTSYAPGIFFLRFHSREFIKWMEIGLHASRKVSDKRGEAIHLGNLAVAYNNLGEYQKAIECSEKNLMISRENDDRTGESNSLGNLGNAYTRLGKHHKAIEYYEKVLELSREIGNRNIEGKSLGNLGSAYCGLGDYQKAIEYFEKDLAIAREIYDRPGEGDSLSNLGITYRRLGEYTKAIEYLGKALVIARELGDRLSEGDYLGNLGTAYVYLGEIDKAKGLWKEAVSILKELESPSAEIFRRNLANLEPD